jgi:hypothetical protein
MCPSMVRELACEETASAGARPSSANLQLPATTTCHHCHHKHYQHDTLSSPPYRARCPPLVTTPTRMAHPEHLPPKKRETETETATSSGWPPESKWHGWQAKNSNS